MSKSKTIYFCQNCGNQSPKWVGKCPACSVSAVVVDIRTPLGEQFGTS
ncbi:MAG: DNA repair protein RadA, partial [Bacteroidetes bacterium]|nr:DNA repair protein RadA [Bacteroidota bacterium]